jgi:hypothetical protein
MKESLSYPIEAENAPDYIIETIAQGIEL